MKRSNVVIWLSSLIVLLALVAAGTGLLYQDKGSPFSFATIRGETVLIYGQSWYHYDTPITAVGFKAADAITLVLAIPLLIVSTILYSRGLLRGGLLLTGVLAYFLYNYGSMAIGAAYNNLFLVYIAIFSASFFGLVLTLMSFDIAELPSHFSSHLPRRGISIFLIVSGIILLFVWLGLSVLPAFLQGKVPAEASYYTTFTTGVIDMALVAPALIVVGLLLLRRAPLGYLLTSTMLIFTAVLGINLTAGGIAQLLAGVVTMGQFIGFTLGFTVLTVIALALTIVLFHNLSESPVSRTPLGASFEINVSFRSH